jgi:hypothetical protein
MNLEWTRKLDHCAVMIRLNIHEAIRQYPVPTIW